MLNIRPGSDVPAETPLLSIALPLADTFDPDAAERELAVLSSHLDAAMHRQLLLIRAIDGSGHWHRQGATSCAHWLSWRVGLDLGAARERIRVGRALAALPAIDGALARGELSYSKVRAMTRVATADNEAQLLAIARASTASQLERVCRGVRKLQTDGGKDDALERWVRLRRRGEATVRLEAELLPDEAERVMEALRVVRARIAGEVGEVERPNLADALLRMADEVLTERDEPAQADAAWSTGPAEAEPSTDAPATRTGSAHRADLCVHLGPDPLGETHAATLEDGTRVSAATLRRLACDCGLVGLARGGDGAILDIGRKTRRIPPAMRRAVIARDRCCAFPGCTHDRFVDVHHAQHWFDGGETKLENLVSLCTFHHRLLHEDGWRVTLGPARAATFIRHDGTTVDPTCTPPRAAGDPLRSFEAQHPTLTIDDKTGLSTWDGRSPDYNACVRSVYARATGSRRLERPGSFTGQLRSKSSARRTLHPRRATIPT